MNAAAEVPCQIIDLAGRKAGMPGTSRLGARLEQASWPLSPALSHAWRALAAQGAHAEPFFQPEWFEAFAGSFGQGSPQLLLSVWDDHGSLRGIAPFARSRAFFGKIPARAYRSLSGIHSCRYDLVLDEEHPERVCAAMWETLMSDRSWDVIEAEDVPVGGGFFELMRQAQAAGFLTGVWSTRKMPRLTLPTADTPPFANCPDHFKSMRSRLKRKLAKLGQEGRVSFEVRTSDHAEFLSRFIALEGGGWKGVSGGAIALSATTRRFYEIMVEHMSARGYVRTYSLEINGSLIAAGLGLVMNKTYYCPKVAYDETYARFSPGQLLNSYVIQDLSQNGFRTYDLLGPRMPWKMVWTTDVREHYNCYIFRPTVKGRLLHAATMHGARMLRRVRHRIYGDPQNFTVGAP